MSNKKYVLMSIKPAFAKLIREGSKKVELRRNAPKVHKGDILIVYESSPVKKITMYCEIEELLSLNTSELWDEVKQQCGVSKSFFDEYFHGKQLAYGIRLQNIHQLARPLSLNEVSPSVSAPQSYCYLSEEQFRKLEQS